MSGTARSPEGGTWAAGGRVFYGVLSASCGRRRTRSTRRPVALPVYALFGRSRFLLVGATSAAAVRSR